MSESQDIQIQVQESGFYKGFNRVVAVASKVIIAVVVIWCLINPEGAGQILSAAQSWSFKNLNVYYIYAVALFILTCGVLAIVPSFGKVKLGQGIERPEFSNFSWFSMMFGAGIGIGMLGYAAGEPLYHFASNPEIIQSKQAIMAALSAAGVALPEGASAFDVYQSQLAAGAIQPIEGLVTPKTESAITSAYRYTFLHWGIGAWACYALTGVTIAFFSYNRGLPLTVRSGLSSLFGKKLEGKLGHVVDISAVIATILGISQTIGLGLSSFASGLHSITGMEWLMTDGSGSAPTTGALMLALFFIMIASTASALSGVGKGIKWLSNINMVLSYGLLAFFLIFGATSLVFEVLGKGILDYIVHLPALTFVIWDPASELGGWQTGWSVFYWAWWIAFAPFVGIFLARISKNRSIREFMLGAICLPAAMCFVWFAFVGGTALDLEMSGVAEGRIIGSNLTYQIFEIINIMLSEGLAWVMSALVVVLLITYLVTSADSAILVVNTINSGGGKSGTEPKHIIVWALVLTAIIASLIIAGGLGAIQSAMIVAAIPFTLIMILMCFSLVKGVWEETRQ